MDDETWIHYHQTKRIMLRKSMSLTDKQEETLFPEIPDYAIINDKVYKLEEVSHLEWTPFKMLIYLDMCVYELMVSIFVIYSSRVLVN